MDDVPEHILEKYRQQRRLVDVGDRENGRAHGWAWVNSWHGPDYAVLRRLERLHHERTGGRWSEFFHEEYDQHVPHHRLLFRLMPDVENEDTADEVWKLILRLVDGVLGTDDATVEFTPAWVQGFADGMMEAWIEVRRQL